MRTKTWAYPRFLMFCEEAGIPQVLAAGILEFVWKLAVESDRDDGVVTDSRTLASSLGLRVTQWDGALIVGALVSTGWLEDDGEYLRVGDWHGEWDAYRRKKEYNRLRNQGKRTGEHKRPRAAKKEAKWVEEDLQCAKWMHHKLTELIDPNINSPDFEKWADEIRLIQERDHRPRREIAKLFLWALQNEFWRNTCHSPKALRKHWIKISTRRDSEKKATEKKEDVSGKYFT